MLCGHSGRLHINIGQHLGSVSQVQYLNIWPTFRGEIANIQYQPLGEFKTISVEVLIQLTYKELFHTTSYYVNATPLRDLMMFAVHVVLGAMY